MNRALLAFTAILTDGTATSVRARRILTLFLVGSLLVLSACDLGDSSALGFQGDAGELCLPASDDRTATVAFDIVTNTTDGPVTVTSVELVDAQRLELVGAQFVELGQNRLALGYMPTDEPNLTVDGGTRAVLELGLRLPGGEGGRATGAVIEFEDASGARGSSTTRNTLAVVPPGQVCG